MAKRGPIRPTKAASLVALVIGAVFVFIGVTVAIPETGRFGAMWTVVVAIITLCHAYNLYSKRGLNSYLIEVDAQQDPNPPSEFDRKLRELNQLKDDGLISDAEFDTKRAALLGERW